MERVFIKDVGRFEAGEVKDYPPSTWEGIAESIGEDIDEFTQIPAVLANELFKGNQDGKSLQGNTTGPASNKSK